MMKNFWSLVSAVAALTLVACNGGVKEYSITGSFDVPASIQVGDSLIERGPLDGVYVYLVSVEGEAIDSALIVNETFTMEGTVDSSDPYFAYIVCDWGAGMLVVEPGDISVLMSGDGVSATGTPLNDNIADFEAAIQNEGESFYAKMYALYNSGDSLSQEAMVSLYSEQQASLLGIIDSTYAANTENLVGVYAVNLIMGQIGEVEELDAFLEDYSEYVKNNPLVLSYRTYLESRSDNLPGLNFDELVPDNNTSGE